MPAKTIIGFYGKSGILQELIYSVKFFFRFLLERLCFLAPVSSIRVFLHKMRGVNIGQGVYIGHDVVIDRLYPDQVTIDDHCSIGDRTMIYAHANIPSNTPLKELYPRVVKSVKIGKGTWVMPGCKIAPGVIIGENSVVAIGAVVTKSVDSHTLVGGSPAKKIREIKLSIPPLTFRREGNKKILFIIFSLIIAMVYVIYDYFI